MSDSTTSINDLPTDPTGGGSNISLIASEKPMVNMDINSSLDQSTITQLVNGLQQASIAGATSLPSRDIPRNTDQLTQDPHIQPNFIPQPQHRDYILENETNQDIMRQQYKNDIQNSNLDNLYDEIQAPLLLAILYFIFQLPVFKQTIFKYFTFLCSTDGNYNLNGLIFTSALYGFLYYFMTRIMGYFNTF